MKNVTSCLLIGFLIGLVTCSFAGERVRVRGYTRKDGTYVAPHYRSAPDGSFYNNWSTKGNVNPYTGEPGTRVSPPSTRSTPSYSTGTVPSYTPAIPRSDYGGRSPLALPTAARATTPAPQGGTDYRREGSDGLVGRTGGVGAVTPSARENLDNESRIRASQRLRALGQPVDVQQTSLVNMLDMESRLRGSRRLRDLGHTVDWQNTSTIDMLDMESRIRASRRLRDLGHSVDWQKTSAIDMLDMESRIRATKRLKVQGIDADWQKHSVIDLINLESEARAQRRPTR